MQDELREVQGDMRNMKRSHREYHDGLEQAVRENPGTPAPVVEAVYR